MATITRDSKGRFVGSNIQKLAQSALTQLTLEREGESEGSVSIDGAQVIDAPKYLCRACGSITDNVLCDKCAPFWTLDPKGHLGIRASYWNTIPRVNYDNPPDCHFDKEFAFDYHGIKFEPGSYAPTPRMILTIPKTVNNIALTSPVNLINQINNAINALGYAGMSCNSSMIYRLAAGDRSSLDEKLANLFKRDGTDVIRNGVQIYIKESFKAADDFCKLRADYGYKAKEWTNDEIAKITDHVKSTVSVIPEMDWIFQREWDAPASHLVNASSCWWDNTNRGQSRCVAKAAGAFTVLDRTARLRMVILPVIFDAEQKESGKLYTTPAYKDGIYATPDAFIIYNSYLRKPPSSREDFPDSSAPNRMATGYGTYSPNLSRVAEALATYIEEKTGKTAMFHSCGYDINRSRYESYVNNCSAGIVCLKEKHNLSSIKRIATNVPGVCRNHGN